jgi:hypothetical protein
MLVETKYDGWILLEGREIPRHPISAMKEQVRLFNSLVG